MELVDQLESHPKFSELLEKEGIDDLWQRDLIRRLNDISDLTGIVVRGR